MEDLRAADVQEQVLDEMMWENKKDAIRSGEIEPTTEDIERMNLEDALREELEDQGQLLPGQDLPF